MLLWLKMHNHHLITIVTILLITTVMSTLMYEVLDYYEHQYRINVSLLSSFIMAIIVVIVINLQLKDLNKQKPPKK
jgi:uncharacterized membrane protein